MGMPPLVHILRPHEDVVGVEWCMGMPPLVHILRPHEDVVGVEWCMGMPPLVHILRPHEDVVGVEWCMGMPPLVHFLNFIFSSEICPGGGNGEAPRSQFYAPLACHYILTPPMHACQHTSRARPDSHLREGSTTRKGRVLQNALLKPAKTVHMPQGDHFISGWTVSWQQHDKKMVLCEQIHLLVSMP